MSGLGVEEGRIMSDCPPTSRKHTAFGLARLAQGLHSGWGMRNGFLFFSVLTAALTALAPTSFGQTEQIDAITKINGETLTSDNADVYFNAQNCADPAATLYDLTLTNGNGITQAYLWAGVQNGLCNENAKRTDTQELCRPMASSTPVNVGDNATIVDLTLQELVDTGIVDCANTALEGQPYEIYAFRSEDPGGNDVTTGRIWRRQIHRGRDSPSTPRHRERSHASARLDLQHNLGDARGLHEDRGVQGLPRRHGRRQRGRADEHPGQWNREECDSDLRVPQPCRRRVGLCLRHRRGFCRP